MIFDNNLEYLNNFLGYGDPDRAKIFFFGIEEHGQCKSMEEFNNSRDKFFTYIINESCAAKNITEKIQVTLSYRLLTKNLNIDLKVTEAEYLNGKVNYNYEFFSNVYPLGCTNDKSWEPINTEITGYLGNEKFTYRNECWEGTGRHAGVKPRLVVLKYFLRFIKNRIESEQNVWIFVMGLNKRNPYCPALKMFPLISEVFNVDPDLLEKESDIKNHKGSNMYHCYNDRIWFTQHPSYGNLNSEDVDKIIKCIIHSKQIS